MILKKVDPTALLYHYFERTPSQFALFDDEFDLPVAWGSKNLVDTVIRNLNKTITICYYKRDSNKISFKKKAIYEGKKETDKTKKG